MSTDLQLGKTDFEFYSRFAKPLILTLPVPQERILAAAWFSKLKGEGSGDEKLRLDYLKLLLFVLQRRKLAGPFTENPSKKEHLDPFGEDYELSAIARQIIEKEQNEKRERCLKNIRGEDGDFPSFITDYSPDLLEYVAAQDIPRFGIHVYYAISKEPLTEWKNSEHGVFPRTPRKVEPLGRVSDTSFAVIEPKQPTGEGDSRKQTCEESGSTTPKRKQRHPTFAAGGRPAPALGELIPEEISPERSPPTWGSNLIEVKEPIDMQEPDTPPIISQHVSVEEIDELGENALQELLNQSINVENMMKEIEAMEESLPDIDVEDVEQAEHDIFDKELVALQEMNKFQEEFEKRIKELESELQDDEVKMLEAEEMAEMSKEKEIHQKEKPIIENILKGEDTHIQLYTETPEEPKKPKTPGRTGLPVSKAKAAVLTPAEKSKIEIENAKSASKPSTSKSTDSLKTPTQKKSGLPVPGKRKILKSETAHDIDKQKIIELKEAYESQLENLETELKRLREGLQNESPSTIAVPKPAEELLVEHKKISPAEEAQKSIEFADEGLNKEDDIFEEQRKELEALEKLEEIYKKFKEEYPPSGYRSPPVFSRKKEIREAGKGLKYRLNEFELPHDQTFVDASTYLREHPEHAPKEISEMTKEEREEVLKSIQRLRERHPISHPGSSGVSSEPQVAKPLTSPTFEVSDLEHLKKLVERSDKLLATAPAEAGVPVTSPKPAAIPERPKTPKSANLDLEEPPDFAQSPPPEPPSFGTPEWLRSPELPPLLTDDDLERIYQEKKQAGLIPQPVFETPKQLRDIRAKVTKTPPSVGSIPTPKTPPGRPIKTIPAQDWKWQYESPIKVPYYSPVLPKGQRTLKEAATMSPPINLQNAEQPDLIPMDEEEAYYDQFELAALRAHMESDQGLQAPIDIDLAPFDQSFSPKRHHVEVQADEIRQIEAEGEQFLHMLPNMEHAKKYLKRAADTAHEVQTEPITLSQGIISEAAGVAGLMNESFPEELNESIVDVVDMSKEIPEFNIYPEDLGLQGWEDYEEIPYFDVNPEDLGWPVDYQEIPHFDVKPEDLGMEPKRLPTLPHGYELRQEVGSPTGWIPGVGYVRPHPAKIIPTGLKTPPKPPTREELMDIYYKEEERDPFAPTLDEMTLDELTRDMENFLIDSPTSRLVATPHPPGTPMQASKPSTPGSPGSPFDAEAFKHKVKRAEQQLPTRPMTYRAGRTTIPRHHIRPHTSYELGDIDEHYEGAGTVADMPVQPLRWNIKKSRLPPPRKEQVYHPEELIGVAAPIRQELQENILDQPIYEEIRSPELRPQYQLQGHETPPHLQYLRTVVRDQPWEDRREVRAPLKIGQFIEQEFPPENLFAFEEAYLAQEEVPEHLKAFADVNQAPQFPEFPEMYAPHPEDFIDIVHMSPKGFPEFPQEFAPSPGVFQVESPNQPRAAQFSDSPDYEPLSPHGLISQPGPSRRSEPARRYKTPADAIRPQPDPCGSPPKMKKYVKTAVLEQSRYDPEHPEESKKVSKGKTFLKFKESEQERLQTVKTSTPIGGAVYQHRSPDMISPTTPLKTPPKILYATKTPPHAINIQETAATAQSPKRTHARKKLYADDLNIEQTEFPKSDWPEPRLRAYQRTIPQKDIEEFVKRSMVASVCPGGNYPGIEVEQSFEEEEDLYVPEQLRDWKWMDEENEDW